MVDKSKYAQIYESICPSNIIKSGTRYERLVAIVLKILNSQDVVIHDLKLIGESEVKHQIDVTIIVNSELKHVLIECKDFDVSGDNVGLSVIRDFWGVVDDIHPTEAIVITCNGFSKYAMKYAKSKNIKLAILRECTNKDLENRVTKISVTMRLLHTTDPVIHLHLRVQESIAKLTNDLKSYKLNISKISVDTPVYLKINNNRIQIMDYIQNCINDYPKLNHETVTLNIDLTGSTIEVGNRGEIQIFGIDIKFDVRHSEEFFEITSNKVATLLLSYLDDSDLIIFEDELIKMRINDSTGEIYSI